jgi:predicted XRE-type DNA-binding protein
MNQFAVWNAITDFASQERNLQDRNRLFLNIGKYLSNELEKSLATQNKKWSERMTWDDALSKAK